MVHRGRPTPASHASRAARRLLGTTTALAVALGGVQLAAASGASADTTPGAPVISADPTPPAGTQSCPAPASGSPSTLALGTVCSFTISPNPADTSVPTGYQFTYPFNPGAPEDMTAADPGNGNSFDAATGVATVTIVVNDQVGTLTANAVDAGNAAGPAAQLSINARNPASLGTSPTFGDYDGDGTPDLVATSLESGDALANGIWFAKGGAGGTVSANAENLAANLGLGVSAGGGPLNFTGAQLVPGDWCGTGENSLLAFYPQSVGANEDAGGGYYLCGDGDHDVLRELGHSGGGEVNLSGNLDDANGVAPTELVDAGNLAGTGSTFSDLISVIDNELVLSTANTPGGYSNDADFGGSICAFGSCAELSGTPSPDGTLDWDLWKAVGYPQSNGALDLYLWNPTTGELVLWTNVTANDAANDGVWSNYTTLAYTQYVIASGTGTGASTWNKGANLELQTADFNGDGIPDLWALDPATATAVAYAAKISGSAAWLVGGAKQSLVNPAHEWELNDLASGSANQATDSGSDTAYPLENANTGATWTTDSKFGAAVKLDGATGYLETNSGPPSLGGAVTAGSSFSIGAWVNPSGPGTVLAQEGTDDSSVFLSAAADGTWQFGINTAGTTAATYAQDNAGSWTAGAWTHVVLTYDASTGHLVLYVNGIRADTVDVSGAATVQGPFVLGANQVGGELASYFPGEIARVSTFDTALTATAVKQLP
jgi:hypothetical protein